MSLPKGVYDALPWLYMTVGALTTALLSSDLKYMPAFLFVCAGVTVLMYRRGAAVRAARHRLRASRGSATYAGSSRPGGR